MLNQISKLSLLVVLAIAFVFTSCEKENMEELTTSNYTLNTEGDTDLAFAQRGGGENGPQGARGQRGTCFELVYPITISYPDGSTAMAADQDALKELKSTWKEENPDAEERPTIVFPIQITQDDATVDIADAAALKAAKEACGGRNGSGSRGGNRGGRGSKCFQPVYPITFNLPDGTVIAVADREEAKEALQAWKEANPDAEERPSIEFPYNVKLQDSSIVAVTSQEDVDALKEACQGDRGDRGGRDGDRGDRGGRGGRKDACFSLVYPYTIDIDGTVATIEDRAGKKAALMAWKEANPDATEKPSITLVFPLTVELEDESTMELADQAALDALKASCSDDEGDDG